LQLTLALLVARIRTDHANNAFASDNFAVTANFLDRSRNFHFYSPKTFYPFSHDPNRTELQKHCLAAQTQIKRP
jgi:hypothetical protein